MIYQGYASYTQKLKSLPETGMGYQIIEAKVIGKDIKNNFIVYNSELFIDLNSEFKSYKRQILQKGYSTVLDEAKPLLIETQSIQPLSKREIATLTENIFATTRFLSESGKIDKHRYSDGKGAKEKPEQESNGNNIFVRLSVYENDHRIDFFKKKINSWHLYNH